MIARYITLSKTKASWASSQVVGNPEVWILIIFHFGKPVVTFVLRDALSSGIDYFRGNKLRGPEPDSGAAKLTG